jgi:hypothetical protein
MRIELFSFFLGQDSAPLCAALGPLAAGPSTECSYAAAGSDLAFGTERRLIAVFLGPSSSRNAARPIPNKTMILFRMEKTMDDRIQRGHSRPPHPVPDSDDPPDFTFRRPHRSNSAWPIVFVLLVLLGGCGVLGALAFFWLLMPQSASIFVAPMPPAVDEAPIGLAPVPDPAPLNAPLPPEKAEALARIEQRGALIGFQRSEVREITFDRQIAEQGLEALNLFPRLRRLGLSQTAVTDDDLRHLNGLTELETLSLRDTKITDQGLEHLKGLTGLKTLELGGTDITDEGLKLVEKLTNLETLDLEKTRVTDAGVRQLQQALPKLKIRR